MTSSVAVVVVNTRRVRKAWTFLHSSVSILELADPIGCPGYQCGVVETFVGGGCEIMCIAIKVDVALVTAIWCNMRVAGSRKTVVAVARSRSVSFLI